VVYGQFLDPRGGILADVTVTRLGPDAFRVVTGAGSVGAEMGWLEANRLDDDGPLTITDESAAWAWLGLWGPAARAVLGTISRDPIDDAALPLRRAAPIRIGPAPTVAARISYAGELGWEIAVEPAWAGAVWDLIMSAGRDVGLETVGYRALEGLRLEKGYRYLGTDLTMLDTPDEAGLGGFVRPGKGPFVGRDAVVARRAADSGSGGPPRRLRTVLVGGVDYQPVFGGEAVRLDGVVVGRLRSAAYGHSVSRTVGTVYLPSTTPEGAELEVDVFDERVPAIVAADVLHDPAGTRMRG
jgi:dimethylglycine oxidase